LRFGIPVLAAHDSIPPPLIAIRGNQMAKPRDNRQADLLLPRLDQIINMKHPLVLLAEKISSTAEHGCSGSQETRPIRAIGFSAIPGRPANGNAGGG
jgi:hypothetical protein